MYCGREGEEMSFDFSCDGEQREKKFQEVVRSCLFIQVWGLSGALDANVYGVIKRHSLRVFIRSWVLHLQILYSRSRKGLVNHLN